MQQTHKDIPPPLNNGSNIPYTTIRVYTKCGQKGHWGVMCINLTSKPESSLGKYTFYQGHNKVNTYKLREKLITNSSHANVQYVKDTIVLEEDGNDPIHTDLVLAN